MLVLVHWYLNQILGLVRVHSNSLIKFYVDPMLKIHSDGRIGLYYGNQGEKLKTHKIPEEDPT